MLQRTGLTLAVKRYNKNTAAQLRRHTTGATTGVGSHATTDKGITRRRAADYKNIAQRRGAADVRAFMQDTDGNSISGKLHSSAKHWVAPPRSGGYLSSYEAAGRGSTLDIGAGGAMLDDRKAWHVNKSGVATAVSPSSSFGEDPVDRYLARVLLPIALRWEAYDIDQQHSPGGVRSASSHWPEELRSLSMFFRDGTLSLGGVGNVSSFSSASRSSLSSSPTGDATSAAWQQEHRVGSADVAVVVYAFAEKMKSVEVLGLGADTVFLLLRLLATFEAWDVSPGLSAALYVAVAERLSDVLDHTSATQIRGNAKASIAGVKKGTSPTQRMLQITRQLRHIDACIARRHHQQQRVPHPQSRVLPSVGDVGLQSMPLREADAIDAGNHQPRKSSAVSQSDLLFHVVAPSAVPLMWSVLPSHWSHCIKRGWVLDALELLSNVYTLGGCSMTASFPPAELMAQQCGGKYGVMLNPKAPVALQQYRFLRYVLEMSSYPISVLYRVATTKHQQSPHGDVSLRLDGGRESEDTNGTTTRDQLLRVADVATASMCNVLLDVLASVLLAGDKGLRLYEETTLQQHSISLQQAAKRAPLRPALAVPASLARSTEAVLWCTALLRDIAIEAGIILTNTTPLLPLPSSTQSATGEGGGAAGAGVKTFARTSIHGELKDMFQVELPCVASVSVELHTASREACEHWRDELMRMRSAAAAEAVRENNPAPPNDAVVQTVEGVYVPPALHNGDAGAARKQRDALLQPIIGWCEALEGIEQLSYLLGDATAQMTTTPALENILCADERGTDVRKDGVTGTPSPPPIAAQQNSTPHRPAAADSARDQATASTVDDFVDI